MARMFHEDVDDNGVSRSTNAHSHGPLPSDQVPSRAHWTGGMDGSHEGHMEPPAEGIVRKTRERVLGRIGSPGAMIFGSDLLPRSERLSREEASKGIEIHDPSCWCDKCHPPQPPPGPAVAYSK